MSHIDFIYSFMSRQGGRGFYHVGKAEAMHAALAEDAGDDLRYVVRVEVHLRSAASQYNCKELIVPKSERASSQQTRQTHAVKLCYLHSGKMATVTGSDISALRPYLSDRFPTMGVTMSAPSPVTCTA
jgi:hypothetical protein